MFGAPNGTSALRSMLRLQSLREHCFLGIRGHRSVLRSTLPAAEFARALRSEHPRSQICVEADAAGCRICASLAFWASKVANQR